MSEVLYLDSLLGQWIRIFCARLYGTLHLSSNDLISRVETIAKEKSDILREILHEALNFFDKNSQKELLYIHEHINSILLEFNERDEMCKTFSFLLVKTHEILNIGLTSETNVKGKGLYIEDALNGEKLTSHEKLVCNIFNYFVRFLLNFNGNNNITFDSIDTNIDAILFSYIHLYKSNSIREHACDMLSVLSESFAHSYNINELFWCEFNKCKKDDEFKNFASLIDIFHKIRFNFESKPIETVALSFFHNFCDNYKKIEHGMLRFKFLNALQSIIRTINNGSNVETNEKYNFYLNTIWSIALGWSKKGKHFIFCFSFLCNLLFLCSIDFYIKHIDSIFDVILKSSKNSDVEFLSLIAELISKTPESYIDSYSIEYANNVNTCIIPLIFSGGEKKKQLKFNGKDQLKVCSRILKEIFYKLPELFVDLFKIIITSECSKNDHKKIRIFVLDLLYELCCDNTPIISKYNNIFYELLYPILTNENNRQEDEFFCVLKCFQVIHSSSSDNNLDILEILCNLLSDKQWFQDVINIIVLFMRKISDINFSLMAMIKIIENSIKSIIQNPELVKTVVLSLTQVYCSISNPENQVKMSSYDGDGSFNYDTTNLMLNLDSTLLVYLFSDFDDLCSPIFDLYISASDRNVKELIGMLTNGTNYLLVDFIEKIDKKTRTKLNILSELSLIKKEHSDYSQSLLECIYSNIETFNKSQKMQLALIDVLSVLVIKNDGLFLDLSSNIIKFLIKQASEADDYYFLLLLDPDLLNIFLQEFQKQKTTLDEIRAWKISTNIFYYITFRDDIIYTFNSISNSVYLYINSFHRNLTDNLSNDFQIRCLHTLQTYACHDSKGFTSIDSKLLINFIDSLFVDDKKSKYSDIYIEKLLHSIDIILKSINFETDDIIWFSSWIHNIRKSHIHNNHIVDSINKVFDTLLISHPSLLSSYLWLSYKLDDDISWQFISSISNVFYSDDDFSTKFADGVSVLLTCILVHLQSLRLNSRRETHKLLQLILNKHQNIFKQEPPRSLLCEHLSLSDISCVKDSVDFLDFVGEYVSSEHLKGVLMLLSYNFSILDSKVQILTSLIHFIPCLVKNESIEDIINYTISITNQCDLKDGFMLSTLSSFWKSLLNDIKVFKNECVSDIMQITFDYGLLSTSSNINNIQIAVFVFSMLFFVFPEDVSDFLLKFILIFDKILPKKSEDIINLIQNPCVNFEFNKEVILASNVLSQIFLLITDNSLFMKLFSNKLPAIIFFAMVTYHIEDFSVDLFHPLLDTFLDVCLFRFNGENKDKFISNIQLLNDTNISHSSFSPELQIQTVLQSQVRRVLAYADQVVNTICSLMVQVDENFSEQFFDLILAISLQVQKCERSIEPLLMIMALKDQMKQHHIYILLLFTLHSLKANRVDLIDALVDIFHSRLIAISNDMPNSNEEFVIIIVIFLECIEIDLRRSFSMHLIQIISDICKKLENSPIIENVQNTFVKDFPKFSDDKYVASLFFKYIADAESLCDSNCESVIICLFEISKFLSLNQHKYNWCLLLGILIDCIRSSIAEISKNGSIKPILGLTKYDTDTFEEYCTFLSKNFTDHKMKEFIVLFHASIFKKLSTKDLFVDHICMKILPMYMRISKVDIPNDIYESVLSCVSLINMVSSGEAKKYSASALHYLLVNGSSNPSRNKFSLLELNPRLELVSKGDISRSSIRKVFVISKEDYPEIELFHTGNDYQTHILDKLWDMILNQLSKSG